MTIDNPSSLLLDRIQRGLPVMAALEHQGSAHEPGAADGATVSPAVEMQVRPGPGEAAGSFLLELLDADARRVIRAAAMFGAAFDVTLVARLLDAPVEVVLEGLQRAADAGVPLGDHGDGHHIEMPAELVDVLEASILPSLRSRWQARVAEIVDTPSTDPLCAAVHLDEVGQHERALERRLDAVSVLVRSGDIQRASEQLGDVLEAVAALSRTPAAQQLRARVKVERARLRWLAAGVDPSFTLSGAFDVAFEARRELGEIAPAALRADLASTIAGIAYDLGDGASIERAREAVNECVAALLREGATGPAVTLLDDQAALELRLGHPSRAADLLDRSLETLVERAEDDPTDSTLVADLADTHHLLARLPLHGVIDAVRPDIAISKALEHCRKAKATYEKLGWKRDLARVVETSARLEAKRGNTTKAREAFESAMRIADEVTDLTGLARITAGLAQVFTESGAPRAALGMLASSIELNREKGSPIGLAFDERILAQVEDAVREMRERDPAVDEELARTRQRLVSAIEATSM
jgi:tetratricopeptide (TPR) repeat protein